MLCLCNKYHNLMYCPFNPYCANPNKSHLLFSSAEIYKKPLWQTVWTKIRLLLLEQSVLGPSSGPLADSHEIKGFYKGYFRQNKGCFIEILTKIKLLLSFYFLDEFQLKANVKRGVKQCWIEI